MIGPWELLLLLAAVPLIVGGASIIVVADATPKNQTRKPEAEPCRAGECPPATG